MRAGFKWSLGLAAALLALIAVAAGAVVVVMNTTGGSLWAVERLAETAPGSLVIDGFDGTLWRGVTVQRAAYDDGARRVEVDGLAVGVTWPNLAAGVLEISRLDADAVRYLALSDAESAARDGPLLAEPLPVEVRIVASRIGSLIYESTGDPVLLEALSVANLVTDGREARIRSAGVLTSGVSVSAAEIRSTISANWPVAAAVRWQLDDGGWSGEGGVRGSLEELRFDQRVAGPYPALVSGALRLQGPDRPRLEMLVNWERWSIGEQQLIDGEARAAGWLDAYTLQYDLTLDALDGHRFAVAGSATGNRDGVDFVAATLDGASASGEFEGSARWSPAFEARGLVRAAAIDPAAFLDGVSGTLAGETRLHVADGVVEMNALSAAGDVNGFPARAKGDLQVAEGRLRCTNCRIDVGANHLLLNGALSAGDVSMTLRLDAPKLGELAPGISGSLTGAGRIAGAPDDVLVTVDLAGRALHFGDERLPLLDADTSLSLRRDPEGMRGTFNSATVAAGAELTWTLQEATRFRWQDGAFSVDSHRWTGTTGHVSVAALAAGPDDALAVSGRIIDLPLSLARGWLPANLQLIGVAEAEIDLRHGAGAWSGTAEWRQTDSILRVLEAEGRQTDIRIPTVAVIAKLVDGGLVADANVAIDPGVTGRLDLALSPLAADGTVTAKLALAGDDWQWISAVVPQIDRFEGSVNALVSASGPLSAPELSGDITWRGGALLVPALNVPLRDIELVVSGGTQGTATLAGTARAGDGRLTLDGRFDNLMRPERSLHLRISGDTAEIVNWPEYRLWATPELVVAGYGDAWRVDGKLTIPRAEITLRELPVGAVAVSPDVVVLGATEPETRPTRISGDVELLLGDRVQIDALGLRARLVGNLAVRLSELRPPVAAGRIGIEDGTFEAYGQKLTIRSGELTFTGPLDDPLVDVRAIRTVETFDGPVVAGLHLTGRAQNLTTTVFSDPAMAEADALSYLVVGRPLNQATEAEGGDLTGAAVALGLKQASRLVEQIGQTLGLDQLSLTGDGGETTALVAGKRVNERLYARYAYGVFSRLGTLLLRYRLSERVVLEAGAGDNQSIDILYSVER